MIYQADSRITLPSYFEFQPMQSLKEMDDERDQQKNLQAPEGEYLRQKLIQMLQAALISADAEIYQVSLGMSHLAPETEPGKSSEIRPRKN